MLIVRFDHPGVARFELDGLVVDVPMDAVGAEAGEYVHLYAAVVAAEYACVAITEGYDGTIEDAVGGGDVVAADDGVVAVAPHHVGAAFGTFLPGDILHDEGL